MSNKQNHNTVKVEIPVEGEYILTILEYILIVKRIFENTYQYSEFTNIEGKYIMTSVNCKNGNVMRIMEEFCKAHNCPKRVLHEEINKAESNKKISDVNFKLYENLKNQSTIITKENEKLKKDIVKYEESILILEDTINGYNELISGYIDVITDLELQVNSVHDKLNKFKLLLHEHTEILSGKKDKEICDKKSNDIIFMYEKIKEFMDINSESKDNSTCMINKFYEEFIKSVSKEGIVISYNIFVDYLKDIYRNKPDIVIDNNTISNIIYVKNNKLKNKPLKNKNISSTILDKSAIATTNNPRICKTKYTKRSRWVRITDNDGKEMLSMWKTMTAKEISKKFPIYDISQISNYCRKNSDFVKRGISKEFIDELRSYNGTKTIAELTKIYGNRNLKRLCKNHNIPYKEA